MSLSPRERLLGCVEQLARLLRADEATESALIIQLALTLESAGEIVPDLQAKLAADHEDRVNRRKRWEEWQRETCK